MKKLLFIIFVLGFCTAAVAADEKSFIYDDHGKRDPLWALVTPSGAVMNYETEVFVSDMVFYKLVDCMSESFF
jgi:hypothetical protein